MHELAVTQSILKLALSKTEEHNLSKVQKIFLQIGELRDIEEEWIQKYFSYVSKGTKAEGAQIKIEWIPSKLRCGGCGYVYRHLPGDSAEPVCPMCGKKHFEVICGREFILKELEII